MDNKNNTNYSNTGYNTGDGNTGVCNTGDSNTGDGNTGDGNTGDGNTGVCNTGENNTGCGNTGYGNTGDSNTGDGNTGDSNTGNWNNIDRETGFFNTKSSKKIRVFNKECEIDLWIKADKPSFLYFKLTEFIGEDNMSSKEKDENSTYQTIGGYLKVFDYKEAFKKSYDKASKEDRDLLLKLPNFDAEVFLEISGIDVRIDNELQEKKRKLIEKANELLRQAEEL